ncbi:hypothetical protein [Cellulosimicrobium sp. NPDC057862]|uniref:hypothetical protein n=1 Tax=Cellulosimicrobium sp. NPDC057862 TaxID=3346266 RepID=UPI00366E5A1B
MNEEPSRSRSGSAAERGSTLSDPLPGAFAQGGDGEPVTLRLARRRPFVLVFGLALLTEAVVVMRHVLLYPEKVEVSLPVAVVAMTALLTFLIGVGVASLWAFFRAHRRTVTIGPDALTLGSGALRLDWTDVKRIAVHVTATRPVSTEYLPRQRASSVIVSLVWCLHDHADAGHGAKHLARRKLPQQFTHTRPLTTVPYTTDLDVPIARDLDTALHHFAGPAYRAPLAR